MEATDIAFLMAGDLHRNIRALKQLQSLSDGGYTVKTFHLGNSEERSRPVSPLPKGVSEEIISVQPGSGPQYFKELSRSFHSAIARHTAALFHASDLYTLSAAAQVANKIGAKYSFDSRELYAHVASTTGRPWVRWWWYWVERRLIPGASGVFTVSDSIADWLAATYHIQRPVVVHNAPERHPLSEEVPHPEDLGFVPPQTMSVLLDDRGIASNVPILVHLGQMKKDRGCKNLIRAMKSVPKAHLVFLGYGPLETKLRELVVTLHLQDSVHFIAPVAPRSVQTALRGATIGVTMLEDTCLNHRFALPNKFFDYIHAGLPVLSSNLKETAAIVNQFEVGMTARPSDPDDIARTLNQMIESPKLSSWANNALIAAETFSWDKATQLFMHEINRILSSPRATP